MLQKVRDKKSQYFLSHYSDVRYEARHTAARKYFNTALAQYCISLMNRNF